MAQHHAVITPAAVPYRVFFDDTLIAESSEVLELVEHFGEKSFPAVAYFPPATKDALDLEPTSTTTRCPIKGEARYWSFRGVKDAVWGYPHAIEGVAEIAGYIAFDPSKGFRVERDD